MKGVSTRRLMRWVGEAWREWTWRHTAAGVVIGLLSMFVFNYASFTKTLFADHPFADEPLLAWAIWNVVQVGWPYVLAMRVADRAAAAGVPRGVAYGSALTVVLVCAWSIFAAPVGLLFDVLADPAILMSVPTVVGRLVDHAEFRGDIMATRLPRTKNPQRPACRETK